MMNENELRIGNIVLVSNEQCHPQLKDVLMKVTSIQHRHDLPEYSVRIERVVKDKFDVNVDYGQLMRFIKPIPLTEELLLKCGFTFSNLYLAYIHDELWVEIKQNDGKGYWRIESDNGEYDNKWYLTSEAEYTVSEKPIEYLHQLQNLYYGLTGDDLEVKL